MMQFDVEGVRHSDGQRVKARVAAASLDEAVRKAANHGISVASASERPEPSATDGSTRSAEDGASRTRARAPRGGRAGDTPASPDEPTADQRDAGAESSDDPGPETVWRIGSVDGGGERRPPPARFSPSILACVGAAALVATVGIIVFQRSIPTPGATSREPAEAHASGPPQRHAPDVSDTPSSPPRASPAAPALPPHVLQVAGGKLTPEPGYSWVSAEEGHFDVRWTPTRRHPTIAHISAATAQDNWVADAGYTFGSPDSLEVHWSPGSRFTAWPHVTTMEKPDMWLPDPGYAFASADSLAVSWVPGSSHPEHSNVLAGTTEGKWVADAGYRWLRPDDPDSTEVVWTPHLPHPTSPHVVSGDTEGAWRAASGYRFANQLSGDLSVVPIGPTEDQIKSALAKLAVAFIGHQASLSGDTDNLGDVLAMEVARVLRDEAINSALIDLFPGESSSTIHAATNLVTLGLDGELTSDNWRSQNARDALAQRLRNEDPDAANAEGLADFVSRVIYAYGS